MPSLDRFASYAQEMGSVPQFPGNRKIEGYSRSPEKSKLNQMLAGCVPLVPHVPPLNDICTQESDWHAFFDERAGIREFDGGLPRAEAERLARADTVALLGPEPEAR